MELELPDIVTLCSQLIAIDSINPFSTYLDQDGNTQIEGNEAEILAFCEAFLQRGGFQTWRQECGNGRQNLLAEKGTGSRSILLYSHVDTVEVKPGWSRQEALTATQGTKVVDGRQQQVLFGLGSNDMKGGLAVLLNAACRANPRTYKLKVALGCDEEFWSLGSACLVHESDFLDDVLGVLVPEVGESSDEPDPDKLLVTLGRCGRAEFLVHVMGTGGHGAEPEFAGRVNAITQAAKVALEIETYSRKMPLFKPFQGVDETCKPSALVTQITGGEGLLSIPAQASLVVNRVLAPSESVEDAKAALETLLQKMKAEGTLEPVVQGGRELWPFVSHRERPTPPLQPYACSPEQPFVKSVLAVVGQHSPYQIGMGVSVADENRFAAEAGLPVVVLGPRGENSHAAKEWVTIDSLVHLEQIYGGILEQLNQFEVSSLVDFERA